MSMMHGWTTGDPTSLAIWTHLPSGMQCRLVLEDTEGQPLTPSAWTPLEAYLPDTDGHSSAHVIFTVRDALVDVECSGEGDVAACRISDISAPDVQAHWDVTGLSNGWQVQQDERLVVVAPTLDAVPANPTQFMAAQHDAAAARTLHGDGLLQEPLAALDAVLAANTLWLTELDSWVTLSRFAMDTTEHAWRLPNWETFLTAVGIAYADPELALANARAAVRLLASGTYLAAEVDPTGARPDISNPPVASFALWKLFQLTGDVSLIEEAYPALLCWHDWWLEQRDGQRTLLFNWANQQETGMPGHPLYEAPDWDPATGLLALNDVGLSSLWALDCYALMRMALAVDDLDRATHLEMQAKEVGDLLNLRLWDARTGIYRSEHWNKMPTERQSLTALLSLIGRIPSGDRAARMIMEHLTQEFETPYLLPTLGRTDPFFTEKAPWSGRVSALLNYLIVEGLRLYHQDIIAERIALSGLSLAGRSWHDGCHLFASYNAETGSGDDLSQDPLAPTGILFSALGVQMLIDMEPWGGLRLGNLSGADMAAIGVLLQGTRYDVTSGPWGLFVSRDGRPWISVNRPVVLRQVLQQGHEASAQVHSLADNGTLRLTFHGFEPGQIVSVRVNGSTQQIIADENGLLEREIPLPLYQGGNTEQAA